MVEQHQLIGCGLLERIGPTRSDGLAGLVEDLPVGADDLRAVSLSMQLGDWTVGQHHAATERRGIDRTAKQSDQLRRQLPPIGAGWCRDEQRKRSLIAHRSTMPKLAPAVKFATAQPS